MSCFIGIDGGGTRSTAVVVDRHGEPLARREGVAGLVAAADPTAGATALAELAFATLAAADLEAPATVLCCALAGLGREEEREELRRALEECDVARTVVLTTDAEAALHDAFGSGPGLLLIAGTGSIAWGRGASGERARAGGWGAVLGDEGSGYALGLACLRSAVSSFDGRGASTELLDRVLAACGGETPEGLIGWAARASKRDIAAYAPLVFAAAASGDGVARALVEDAAKALALHVAALRRRLAPWPETPALALAGGLLLQGRPLRHPLLAALERSVEPVQVLDRVIDGARGAASLAREENAA